MHKASASPLSMAIAFVISTMIAISGPLPVSHARGRGTGLKTLRLDYFYGSAGKLALTLDPAQVISAHDLDTIDLVQANLVKISTTNKVIPDLATWTVSKNKKSYFFTIRKGARFNDGKPVTAQDVVWSMTRALLPSTASNAAGSYMSFIEGASALSTGKATKLSGVNAISKNKLRITLTQPVVFFLDTLSYPTSDVLEKAALNGRVASNTNNYLTKNCPANNHGAGPFRFVCFGDAFFPAGQTPSYTLVPSSHYYGKRPHVKLLIRSGPNVDMALNDYSAGRLDMTSIPPAHIANWKDSTQFRQFATSIVSFLTPNTKAPPFSDVHCRLAVQYGLDREVVNRVVLHNASNVYYGVVPAGFLGYVNEKKLIGYNPLKARTEFQKCPFKTTPVALKYAKSATGIDNQYGVFAEQLRVVGFNVRAVSLAPHDWSEVVSQDLSKTGTQLVQNSWQQDYPDPQDYCELLLKSDQQFDVGRWKNSTYDRLVTRADTEFNQTMRAKIYEQAEKIALTQGAWIPISNPFHHELIKPYVFGLAGTVAYADMVPVNQDWSRVTLGH